MPSSEISAAEALYLIDLADHTVRAHSLAEMAEAFLPGLVRLIQTPAACLFLQDLNLSAPSFFHTGLLAEAVPIITKHCTLQFHPEPGKSNLQPLPAPLHSGMKPDLDLA